MGHRHQIIHKLNKQFVQRAAQNASAGSVELKMKAAHRVLPRLQMNTPLPRSHMVGPCTWLQALALTCFRQPLDLARTPITVQEK